MGGRGTAPQLELEVATGPDGPVVSVRGELDAFTCDEMAECLREVVPQAGTGDVTLDVSGLELIDSLSLGVLVRAQRDLTSRGGGRLVLRSPSPLVRQVLELTGLDQIFSVR
jgi:anti-sigma B factor antagonist